MAYMNVSSKPIKLTEGWLQHKNSQETKWTPYWCVLKDYVIYIFKNEDTSRDNHIGVLSIGPDTQVKIGESDPKKGYRFDLFTAKKLNKFKTTKFIERELWKAYLVGLTEGDISDNFDLTSDQIQKVRNDIQRVMSGSSRPPLPMSPRQSHDNTSVGTGFSSPDNSVSSIFTPSSPLDGGGPTIRHRFWPNPDLTQVPSWFFTSITRDTAQSILTTGRDYGNTLMRESVTFRDTGSYVITKKMEHSRGPPFNHFEVIRVAEGFKINVENAHKTMKCLSEVMEYFVRMSGSAVTRPMVTNDFKVLGLDIPDYHTKIPQNRTNAESGEDDTDHQDSYEEPLSPNSPSSVSKTWSQSTKLPRAAISSSGDSRYGMTVNPGQGSRARPRVDATHLRHSVDAANVMNQFDKTLNRLSIDSQSSPYQGHTRVGREPSSETEILDGLGEAPPPPCPGRRPSDGDIQAPPVSHPRWQSRAKSVPILPIPPNLEQEVRLSDQIPKLVKPSQTPPRVLPKPPREEEEEQTMSPFLRQLQEKKNAMKRDQDNKKRVTFDDIQSTRAAVDKTEDVDSSGAMDRDAFKKKLNMMLGGAGPMVGKKPTIPTSPLSPSQTFPPPPPEEEEDYDEVIYEPLD